ncbi:MAG: PilZ domain-containing protein [Hyphomicrobiales bacterium]|nr:PilZ domain-containing protein [Hyphomicrobiales bacterium]MCP5372983.1 PilZ domain-containing protein [Hyphomicrobiales bacterium]
MTDGAERRAHRRWPIDQEGTVHLDGAHLACRAVDVSRHGMRLALDGTGDPVAVGTMAIVELAGLLPFKGRVVRAGGAEMGLHFADALPNLGT